MARGWESKSVEAQQAEREQGSTTRRALSATEAVRVSRRQTLSLARARAEADLDAARSPAHRAMLEAAVAALDEQLRALEDPEEPSR